jgi:hypothetical protein
MFRPGANSQPFAAPIEGFCEAPDRSSTVFSRFRLVGAVTIAPAIRSVPPRTLLTQSPETAALNVDARRPQLSPCLTRH